MVTLDAIQPVTSIRRSPLEERAAARRHSRPAEPIAVPLVLGGQGRDAEEVVGAAGAWLVASVAGLVASALLALV